LSLILSTPDVVSSFQEIPLNAKESPENHEKKQAIEAVNVPDSFKRGSRKKGIGQRLQRL
jgi:hypothetical protein